MIGMVRKINAPVIAISLLLFTQVALAEGYHSRGPKVLASIFPLHGLAAGVMEGIGKPALLLNADVSPHHFSLKPSQAFLLQEADLIIWVGGSLEFPLESSIANLPVERSLTFENHTERTEEQHEQEEGHHAHEEQHEQEEVHHAHEEQHEHEDQHFNAHLWLDPSAAKEIVKLIGARLQTLDPTHEKLYSKNVIHMLARLDALEVELSEQLRPIRKVPYIVFHDAYGPFERHFGLNNVGVVTKHAEDAPSAGRIRHMIKLASENKAQCIFREPQFNPHAIKIIAEKLDIRIGKLDPLGVGLTLDSDGYFKLMRNLGENFVDCLS